MQGQIATTEIMGRTILTRGSTMYPRRHGFAYRSWRGRWLVRRWGDGQLSFWAGGTLYITEQADHGYAEAMHADAVPVDFREGTEKITDGPHNLLELMGPETWGARQRLAARGQACTPEVILEEMSQECIPIEGQSGGGTDL